MTTVERFAPSPTGPLHLGHAFSALTAWDAAEDAGGQFLLRIEDIDQSRSRDHWEAQIYDDLAWLGLDWATPIMRQSERLPAYRTALTQLWDMGLLYVCTCTRRDIETAASAPQEGAPLIGPDGIVYPRTCAGKPDHRVPALTELPDAATLRLDMELAAVRLEGRALEFFEIGATHEGVHTVEPRQMILSVGDIVVARAGMGTSYHMSVVVDDAAQGVSHVTRGEDLFEATAIHVVLQALLNLPTPIYRHHRLIRDDAGKRLAKRDDARAIATFRDDGVTPEDIRAMVGL